MRFRNHNIAWRRWVLMAGFAHAVGCHVLVRADEPSGRAIAGSRPHTASNQSIAIEQPEPASVTDTGHAVQPSITGAASPRGPSSTGGRPTRVVEATQAPSGGGSSAPSPGSSSGRLRRRSSEQSADRPRTMPSPFDLGSLLPLGLVLLALAGAFWLVRRFVPSLRQTDHTALQVVARTAVSPKHSVALIRLGRRYVMVGVGGDRMAPLCEVADPEEVAELTAHFGGSKRASSSSSSFNHLLIREAGEFSEERGDRAETLATDGHAAADDESEQMPALIRLRRRLRSLKAG